MEADALQYCIKENEEKKNCFWPDSIIWIYKLYWESHIIDIINVDRNFFFFSLINFSSNQKQFNNNFEIFFPFQFNRFDSLSKYAFVGDYAGQITMLRCEKQGTQLITTFKGHTGKMQWILISSSIATSLNTII